MKRIDELIQTLNSTEDTISIKPVEAILLSELYSESIKINERGELLLTRDTVIDFSNFIFSNPTEFLKYVKSIETKIDQTNEKNKVKLGDLLFMMRNARKFGLSINKEAGENDYKIKAAIHEKNFKNTVINFVPEDNIVDESYVFKTGNTRVKNLYIEQEEEELNDAEENSNVEEVVKLNNGRILIVLKDGTKIEKDDFNIYSIEHPEENIDKRIENKSKGQNGLVNEHKKEEDENLTFFKNYVARFGNLDAREEKLKKPEFLRYRAMLDAV